MNCFRLRNQEKLSLEKSASSLRGGLLSFVLFWVLSWGAHAAEYVVSSGSVDFVCPRGWCYITDSEFFGHSKSASIWHDGDFEKSQKFVIVNSRFDGVPGFPLGRNHRYGHIYLLSCSFSERMVDVPIYHPPTSQTEWKWGACHYYLNSRRNSGSYAWFRNNLEQASGSPNPETIAARWTFDGEWDLEASVPAVLPFAYFLVPKRNSAGVNTAGLTLRWVPGRIARTHTIFFGRTSEPQFLKSQEETSVIVAKLDPKTTYCSRVDEVTDAGIIPGTQWSFTTGE